MMMPICGLNFHYFSTVRMSDHRKLSAHLILITIANAGHCMVCEDVLARPNNVERAPIYDTTWRRLDVKELKIDLCLVFGGSDRLDNQAKLNSISVNCLQYKQNCTSLP